MDILIGLVGLLFVAAVVVALGRIQEASIRDDLKTSRTGGSWILRMKQGWPGGGG